MRVSLLVTSDRNAFVRRARRTARNAAPLETPRRPASCALVTRAIVVAKRAVVVVAAAVALQASIQRLRRGFTLRRAEIIIDGDGRPRRRRGHRVDDDG